MIVVSINGGLGNQLFQYAFGKNLAHIHQCEVHYDLSVFKNSDHRKFALDYFNTKVYEAKEKNIPYRIRNFWKKYPRLSSILDKIIYDKKILVENQFRYNQQYLAIAQNSYLWGYWQSAKYFSDVKERIMEDFTFKNKGFEKVERDVLERIERSNSVCLHIRRGDYINNPTHPLCELSYYEKAIELIKTRVDEPHFFIFSDDISWCKNNLNLNENFEFVTTDADWKDLRLMTYCKHNIIANSSFSWWGAYLGKFAHKIVISPKVWFSDDRLDITDLKPDNWISI
jgi:hypothetical protein